jgi:redox-sensing transcriptional repressor
MNETGREPAPGGSEWPLLAQVREIADGLEGSAPELRAAATLRLRQAAQVRGLLPAESASEVDLQVMGSKLEEECPPFDVDTAATRLKEAAQARGLLRTEGAAAMPGGIPEATVARLPIYLRVLYALAERGVDTVESHELARLAGVNSAKLRKDLSHLGSYGIRGVGYDVEYLVYQVSRALGLTQRWPVVIVGAGNLGRALANYGGFLTRGFHIEAVLDSDPSLVGRQLGGAIVRHLSELEALVAAHGIAIGVIAVPAGAAQAVCDRLVAVGVTSILNFAPMLLNVPAGVDVRKVDLSIELQILAFHAQRRSAEQSGQVSGSATGGASIEQRSPAL